MKNIHVLPTDKPSQLYAKDDNYKLANSTMAMDWYVSSVGYKPYNIYITSDEEIKEGDWFLNTLKNQVNKCDDLIHEKNVNLSSWCKKIILTTDKDLIKDGVKAIDDDFLEWFVKNPSCEYVEVKRKKHFELDKSKRINPLNGFYYSCKIIIPKEEEPKQKTFEEVVKPLMKWLCENTHTHTTAIVTGNLAELVESLENEIQSDMTFMEVLGLIRQANEMEKKQELKKWIETWSLGYESGFNNCMKKFKEKEK
jgi:hypothetical protein